MHRVSSYFIGSHVEDNKVLLVHGYSGAIDLVDGSVLDILESYKHRIITKEIIEEDLCYFLKERGYITEKTELEERDYVSRMANALNRKNKILNASFTIVVTYDCNLCCPYCFEKEYAWKLKQHTMDKEAVDKLYSTIDDIQTKNKKINRNITLFGGEPLLRKNFEIVEYIVSEGHKRGMKFSAITNGFELDAFLQLINPDEIGHLQITMDGVGETHDRTRCHREGIPTFDKIVHNIRLALDKNISVSVRFNADKNNYSDFEKLEKYFSEKGFDNYKKFRIIMSRTVDYSQDKDSGKYFSQTEFVNFIDKNVDRDNVQDFAILRMLSSAIKSKKPISYKGAFCSSQINGYVFDPMLRIFPCWEVIGDENNCIGDFSEGKFREKEDVIKFWRDGNCYNDNCNKCPSYLFCGGGCFAKNIRSFKCTRITDIIKHNAKKIYRELKLNDKII